MPLPAQTKSQGPERLQDPLNPFRGRSLLPPQSALSELPA